MKTSDLFESKSECCGCELCVQVCPQHIIHMEADNEGFFYPQINNNELCLNCHRCTSICPIKHNIHRNDHLIQSFGGYAKSKNDIKFSSSGGIATVISREFIEKKDGVVYGVKYDTNFQDILYTRCEAIEDLEFIRTSKYAQARKYEIYKKVSVDLKKGLNVLFLGLPCDIVALYNYIGSKDKNLYTINLICHGPTSLKVHKEYIESLKKRFQKNEISSFSVRYKKLGWKPYFVRTEFADGMEFLEEFHKSDYGIAFKYLKRPSCAKCKFKVKKGICNMPSDLTIGDFHAARPGMKEWNHWGVSQVSVHTIKGNELIDLITEKFYLSEISNYTATHYNYAFEHSIKKKPNRSLFVNALYTKSLHEACSLKSINVLSWIDTLKGTILKKLANIKHYIIR